MPEALNALPNLSYGLGLWVKMSEAAIWEQAGETTEVEFAALNLSISIPEGALPEGVSADDIRVAEAKIDDEAFDVFGLRVAIDESSVLAAVTLEPSCSNSCGPSR